jgi:hypothetical protein
MEREIRGVKRGLEGNEEGRSVDNEQDAAEQPIERARKVRATVRPRPGCSWLGSGSLHRLRRVYTLGAPRFVSGWCGCGRSQQPRRPAGSAHQPEQSHVSTKISVAIASQLPQASGFIRKGACPDCQVFIATEKQFLSQNKCICNRIENIREVMFRCGCAVPGAKVTRVLAPC